MVISGDSAPASSELTGWLLRPQSVPRLPSELAPAASLLGASRLCVGSPAPVGRRAPGCCALSGAAADGVDPSLLSLCAFFLKRVFSSAAEL